MCNMTHQKYGAGKKRDNKGKKKKKEVVEYDEILRPTLDENRPYNELCHFADEFKLHVEIDKPFAEMDQMFLKITDKNKKEIKKVTLDSMTDLDTQSASILNELGKIYK